MNNTSSIRGASYPASNITPEPATPRGPFVVPFAYILAVAPLTGAAALVAKLVDHLFDVATHGALERVRARIVAVEELVASGAEACRRIAANLEQLEPNRVIRGGDQERTLAVRINIGAALALAAATVPCDWLLVRAMALDVSPELASDLGWLIPMAFPVLAATFAIKYYAVLKYKDAADRSGFENLLARLMLGALPVMLGALAWRLAGMQVSVVDALLADSNPARELAISVACFAGQLAAQSIVAAGALVAAEKMLHATRPSSSVANEHYLGLKEQLDVEAELLARNQDFLGLLLAQRTELEAERAAFLGDAEATLVAEQLALQATENRLKSMREASPRPTPPPSHLVNGHRFTHTSTSNIH